jgi:hypothetical protein
MIEMHAIIGGGETRANFPGQQDQSAILADMDNQIAHAGCPTLAFQLMQQKQALEDRVRWKGWLSHCRDGETGAEPRPESQHFLRRAQAAVLL